MTTILTMANTHELWRNLRRCYTDCYTWEEGLHFGGSVRSPCNLKHAAARRHRPLLVSIDDAARGAVRTAPPVPVNAAGEAYGQPTRPDPTLCVGIRGRVRGCPSSSVRVEVPDIDGYVALAMRGAFPELAYRWRRRG